MKRVLLFVIVVAATGQVSGAELQPAWVLIPIAVPTATPGTHDSIWQSELWVRNDSTSLGPVGADCQHIYEGQTCPPLFPPGKTVRARALELQSAFGAVMMYMSEEVLPKATLSNRFFELSKHAQPAGVEVPVVREGEFFTKPVRFIAINGNSANRVALRVYHTDRLETRFGGAVRLEFFRADGSLITSKDIGLQYKIASWPDPGFLGIYDLVTTFPELQGTDRYDINVTPLKPGMQFYALASITDLDTQQVLIITTRESAN